MSDADSRLVLDIGALDVLANQLAQVQSSFASLGVTTDVIAGYVGDQGKQQDLAAHVRDVNTSWADHRDAIAHNVQALAQQVRNVANGFTETDGRLATAVDMSQS